jgi:hypothetical protein
LIKLKPAKQVLEEMIGRIEWNPPPGISLQEIKALKVLLAGYPETRIQSENNKAPNEQGKTKRVSIEPGYDEA